MNSSWQKSHFGLTVAAHDDDRLTFGCDFASTFFAEVVLALVVVSSTSHRWAIKSNSCLSGGGSWPIKEVPHSRNVSESSLEDRMGTRIPVHHRTLQCLKGVQMFRNPVRDSSEIDWIFPCHSRQIQYSIDVSLNNHALVVISLLENCPRDRN